MFRETDVKINQINLSHHPWCDFLLFCILESSPRYNRYKTEYRCKGQPGVSWLLDHLMKAGGLLKLDDAVCHTACTEFDLCSSFSITLCTSGTCFKERKLTFSSNLFIGKYCPLLFKKTLIIIVLFLSRLPMTFAKIRLIVLVLAWYEWQKKVKKTILMSELY